MDLNLFEEGERRMAACPHCAQTAATTFARRNIPLNEGEGMAKAILVEICDACGAIAAIPAQSMPAIRETRQRGMKSLEALLPAIYMDVLDLALYGINPANSSEFRKIMMAVYFHRFASGLCPARELIEARAAARTHYKERRGGARRRLSMRMTSRVADDLAKLTQETRMSQTDVVKSVIFRIQQDVLELRDPALIKELVSLSLFSS
jgi:hypothetical protein